MNDLLGARRCKRWLAPAAWLLASLFATGSHAQRPAANPLAAGTAPPATMQAYPIVGAAARGVAGKLTELYANRPEVQVLDTSAGYIVVTGPAAAQNEIA